MGRVLKSFLLVIALAAVVFSATPDREFLEEQIDRKLAAEATRWLAPRIGERAFAVTTPDPADREFGRIVEKALRRQVDPPVQAGASSPARIAVSRRPVDGGSRLQVRLEGSPDSFEVTRRARPLSVLPSLLAVFLALATRRSGPALLAGLLAASFLLRDGSIPGTVTAAGAYLVDAANSSFSLAIVLFVLALIGAISVMAASGGIRGLVMIAQRILKGPRSVRLATALAGLIVFFDDYSNCVVVGTSMRPLTDRFRVSREKLAYLVDSTAAPLASLTLLSTWAWFEVSLMGDPLVEVGVLASPSEAVRTFWQVVPFRFYCLATLITLFLGIALRRDLGPMASAESRTFRTGQPLGEGSRPLGRSRIMDLREKEGITPRPRNALIPLLTVIVALIVGFTVFSRSLSREAVIAGAALLGSLVAVLLAVIPGTLTVRETAVAWFAGARAMLYALAILFFAWAIGESLRDLGTADYCVACVRNTGYGVLLPLFVFLLSSVVAFSTGSSWSTMALMLPTVIPIAYEVGGSTPAGALGLTLITMAAVLDGSIFGDHCSPLSDTTILTSAACCCDHIDHVRTQLPYAMVSMVVAAAVGYIPAAMGWSPFLFLPVAAACLFVVLRVFGKDPERMEV